MVLMKMPTIIFYILKIVVQCEILMRLYTGAEDVTFCSENISVKDERVEC